MPARARPAAPEVAQPARLAPPFASAASGVRAFGDSLGGLRLLAPLHRGRYVDVWRAEVPPREARPRPGDGPLGAARPVVPASRTVAVKTAAAAVAGHPGTAAWLRREHRVLAALGHAHVVEVLGLLEPAPGPMLVLDYLEGGDLVPLLGAAPRHWLGAAAQVGAALRHVHARGFVHGDVTPRNVLFRAPADESPGAAVLADFGSALPIGAARRTAPGTAAYRPLRYAADRAAPEDDVYGFAVLLYQLLSGRLPYGPRPDRARGAGPPRPLVPQLPALGTERHAERQRRPQGVEALEALIARIMAALTATEPVAVGTLTEFCDVIESVRTGFGFGAPTATAGCAP